MYLALGSNVGDSKSYIDEAVRLLGDRVTVVAKAPIYVSKAVGYTEQADFLNTAIKVETDLRPEALLEFVKEVEQKVGRIERFRWGPREVDIDIILYGEEVLESEDLTIPHPYFRERDFVLKPLSDIAADAIDPLTSSSVEELLAKIPTSEASVQKKTTD